MDGLYTEDGSILDMVDTLPEDFFKEGDPPEPEPNPKEFEGNEIDKSNKKTNTDKSVVSSNDVGGVDNKNETANEDLTDFSKPLQDPEKEADATVKNEMDKIDKETKNDNSTDVMPKNEDCSGNCEVKNKPEDVDEVEETLAAMLPQIQLDGKSYEEYFQDVIDIDVPDCILEYIENPGAPYTNEIREGMTILEGAVMDALKNSVKSAHAKSCAAVSSLQNKMAQRRLEQGKISQAVADGIEANAKDWANRAKLYGNRDGIKSAIAKKLFKNKRSSEAASRALVQGLKQGELENRVDSEPVPVMTSTDDTVPVDNSTNYVQEAAAQLDAPHLKAIDAFVASSDKTAVTKGHASKLITTFASTKKLVNLFEVMCESRDKKFIPYSKLKKTYMKTNNYLAMLDSQKRGMTKEEERSFKDGFGDVLYFLETKAEGRIVVIMGHAKGYVRWRFVDKHLQNYDIYYIGLLIRALYGYSSFDEKFRRYLSNEIKKDELRKKREGMDIPKLQKESVDIKMVLEKAMEYEIKPIVDKLNKLGYKVKYASPGHYHLRKKEDSDRDGVFYSQLYTDARIMFDDDYKLPEPPEYWKWRTVDKCDYLDVKPITYNKKDGNPDQAFAKWKEKYMESLTNWVDNLDGKKASDITKANDNTGEQKEKHKEHPDDLKESVDDAMDRLFLDFKLDM